MRTCTNTISSLALTMQRNPTPECMAECNEIIACCTEMLNIASESYSDTTISPRPKHTHSFPSTHFRELQSSGLLFAQLNPRVS